MSHRLLIVDDSVSMRAVIIKVISMTGFVPDELLQAGNGREALDVLALNKVDLVFTDINMPEMSGLEMLQAMRADPALAEIPVIVITTEGSAERRQEAQSLGATGFLQKPFQPADVKNVFETTLGWRDDS